MNYTLEPTMATNVTINGTLSPTVSPSFSQPTFNPTTSPTASPSYTQPTMNPTFNPTTSPTPSPVTVSPTWSPTTSPVTGVPSFTPSWAPTANPTLRPTLKPSFSPTTSPTTGANPLIAMVTSASAVVQFTLALVTIAFILVVFMVCGESLWRCYHKCCDKKKKKADVSGLGSTGADSEITLIVDPTQQKVSAYDPPEDYRTNINRINRIKQVVDRSLGDAWDARYDTDENVDLIKETRWTKSSSVSGASSKFKQ